MKYLFLLLFTTILAGGLLAQSEKNTILVGLQSESITPIYLSNTSHKNIKIGLPTFSYAASVEKRFSLHKKLNFSFQYSLKYYKQNRNVCPETNGASSNSTVLTSAININVFYPFGKSSSFYSGVGVSQAVSSYFAEKKKQSNQAFSSKDVNPSLIFGIENSTRLFNLNLFYSVQYNIGFFPYSHLLQTETSKMETTITLPTVQFGLKYKY